MNNYYINNLKKIVTGDKSITFLNEKFDETYHSISGAREEAVEKYVKPLGNILKKENIKVLDFCFGLGYNTFTLLDNFSGRIEIDAVEIDINIIKKIIEIDPIFKSMEKFSRILKERLTELQNNKYIRITLERAKINLFIDDGRDFIKKTDKKYDAVLFDPFSPKKQPEMWRLEIFKTMYNILNKNGRMTTYSCAGWIRRNMKEAGFIIEDGPRIGRRSPSTIAIKEQLIFE